MKKPLLIAIAFLLGAWSPAPPAGISPLYSQVFQLDGNCDGTDMVTHWTITGQTNMPSWYVSPWQSSDISIRGVELAAMVPLSSSNNEWYMLGDNTLEHDALIHISPGETREAEWFPAGLAWEFPGTSDAGAGDYFDVHGYCGSGHRTFALTIFYTSP